MPEGTASSLEEQVKGVIADVIRKDVNELKLDANFWKDLGVDSIKAIEITVAIERNFKISIRDEQIPQISTVGEAIKAVKDALEKKNA